MFSIVFWSSVAYYCGLLLSDKLYFLNAERIIFYSVFFVLMPMTVSTVAYMRKKMRIEILWAVPLCFILGVYIIGIKGDKSLCELSKYENEEISVCAVVCSDVKKYSQTSSFMLNTEYIVLDGKRIDINEKIKVSSADIPKIGTEVIVFGKLKPISERLNSTSFDRVKSAKSDGVFYSLYSERVLPSGNIPKLSWIEKLLYSYISSVNKYTDSAFDDTTAGFLKGMLLKNKSEIPDDIYSEMQYSGLSRYIYSPYLHASVLLGILFMFVSENRKKIFATAVVLLIYLYLNMTVSSAWKICIFVALSKYLVKKRGVPSGKEALMLTVLLTGIFSPFTLLEGGFILSCLCTLIIISLSPQISAIFGKRNFVTALVGYAAMVFIPMPLASQLGYCLTPYSFLAGMAVMPIMAVCYVLFGISALLNVTIGISSNMLIPILLKIVVYISGTVGRLPFANVYPKAQGIFFCMAFYAAVYALYLFLLHRRRDGILALAATLILFVPNVSEKIIGKDVAEVIFVNVDQGDCSVIKLPDGKAVMIDGGGSPVYSDYDIGAAEVVPFLERNGIEKLEAVILSHYDKDHADGIVTVMDNVPIKEIFMPDYLPNNLYRDIIEAKAASKGISIRYINSSCRTSLGDAEIDFIYTQSQKNATDDNGKSLVARITYMDTSVLYTGDVTREAEADIEDVHCDIMKIPHHGSKTSTSQHLLNEATPVFCVFSLGKDNQYNFPNQLVVDRCLNSGGKILRTDLLGDIHFYIDKTGIKRIYCFKGAVS